MPRPLRDPSSFFDPAPLTPSECQMFSDIGKAAFSKLLETTRFIRRLAAQEPSHDSSKHVYGATINIAGSLEELAHLFVRIVSSGDSVAHRKIAAQLYCADTTARIHTIEMPSTISPFHYAGLRWTHVKSPMRMLVRDRDFCAVEYVDEYIDENGKRGFAMCTHSVPHVSCPELTLSSNYVRAFMYNSGYVITETDRPNVLRVTIYFDYGAPGKITQARLLQALTKRRVRRMEEIYLLIGLNANGSQPSTAPPADEDTCSICSRNFKSSLSFLQRKVQCRLCQQTVCRRCSDEERGGRMRDRVCHACLRDMHPAFNQRHHQSYNIETGSALSYSYAQSHSLPPDAILESQRSINGYQPYPRAYPPPEPIKEPTPKASNFSLDFHRFTLPAKSTTKIAPPVEVHRGAPPPSFDNRLPTPGSERPGSIFDRPSDLTPRGNQGGFVTPRRGEPLSTPRQQFRDPVSTPRQQTREPLSTPRQKNREPVSTPRQQTREPLSTPRQKKREPVSTPRKQSQEPVSTPRSTRSAIGTDAQKGDALCDLSYLTTVMRSSPSKSTKLRKSNRMSNQSGNSTVSVKSTKSSGSDSRPKSDLSYLSSFKN
ncbi:unnamed protein product [Aphanomyces euteiches]|uniref:FYVE-type domain-containing protein n=1 Tax=Aphanomyces euteiches TaxID=100861 RepID=A0A6G0WZ77_9STRA|nr:hypothetical protein Ae201684_010221 [Aphanomyces euteiches]KAH9152848.1 hypothetical protein AeRB84_004793 [Aphanomyces euteiches]